MALKQTSVSSQLRAADLPVCQTACRLTPQRTCSTSSAAPAPALRCRQVHSSAPYRQRQHLQPCSAVDPDKQASSWSVLPSRFNPAYAAIVGFYAALFALQNPYIFAALSIVTIIPQNSTTTSLNSLVILFYESGLFMNFAEAVYCVRLVTWLSILCCLASFSIFN